MKKTLLGLALSALLATGTAFGAGMNQFMAGQLVPHVIYSTADGDTTTIAMTSRFDGNLHWAFFDTNGNRLAFGQTPVLADSRTGFNWQTMANNSMVSGLDGKLGYLLFALDSNTDGEIDGTDARYAISGNAFLVNLAEKDATFIPTIAVDRTALNPTSIAGWTNNPITSINEPAQQAVNDGGDTLEAEYLIDGTAGTGDNTSLVFWHTEEVATDQIVTIHDGSGTSKDITLQFLNDHLNVFDLEAVTGVTAGFFGDGFIRMTVPTANGGGANQMTGFTVVEAPFVGAKQSTLFNVQDF